MTRSSIYRLLLATAAVALGVKAWRATRVTGPQIIATPSVVGYGQCDAQSNHTPTNPDVEARLDIHFSSRGRPAPPRYK